MATGTSDDVAAQHSFLPGALLGLRWSPPVLDPDDPLGSGAAATGRPGAASLDGQRSRRRVLFGRLAAVFYAGSGLLGLVTGWLFEVTDNGGGLPPGEEQLVFEAFRTGSSPTGRTGLGQSIVRGIARAHGGDCGVVNRPGRGATFWIRISR